MQCLYKLLTQLVYWLVFRYGKHKCDAGSQLWKGRLGLIAKSQPSCIWLHAASVGEVRVVGHLINYLLKRDPSLTIHITTMTKTGFNTALQAYQSENISHSYFPLDAPSSIRKSLDVMRPRLAVIAETEIWPNFISELAAREIPIILVNARMTKKAFRRYNHLRSSMKSLLNRYDRFFFKTKDDASRYEQLGVDPAKGIVAGDMKFDAPLLERTKEKMAEIRQRCSISDDAFMFVAGSTRPGEEAIIANSFIELRNDHPDLTMVIAPRHIERTDEIKALFEAKGIDFAAFDDNPGGQRVVLVDRVGILNDLYLGANVSFVGGTLVDIGGHNVLEPVWAGSPVLFGPSVFNVQESVDYIIENNYGAMVQSEEELVSLLKKMLSGDILYATKRSRDLDKSPTAAIGEYLLEKLKYA